jgi:uncharacterized protein YkwD
MRDILPERFTWLLPGMLLLGAVLASLLRPAAGYAGDPSATEIPPRAYLAALRHDLTATPSPTPEPVCGTLNPSSDESTEAIILSGINGERANHSVPPVLTHIKLVTSARRHSWDMADNNLTSHTGSDGTSPWDRISDACYDWVWAVEIIGWDFGGNPNAMLNWWNNSTIHHNIILNNIYQDVGVAYSYRPSSDFGHYWVVNFGREASDMLDNIRQPEYLCEYAMTTEEGGSSIRYTTSDPCP